MVGDALIYAQALHACQHVQRLADESEGCEETILFACRLKSDESVYICLVINYEIRSIDSI